MLRLGLFLLAILAAAPAAARESYVDQGIPSVRAAALPGEARQTLALIRQGGPFLYRKDGSVFGNFERRLPARPHGYYREYTVPTPGLRDRGAQRIVAGRGSTGNVRTSGEYYFTNDHYRSFRRIRE